MNETIPAGQAPTAADTVLLFGHGARDPQWAGPMQRIRARMLAVPNPPRVELAFLELMNPSLPEAIAAAVGEGARHILVVPVFLAQGGHLKRDVPVLIATASAAHPDCRIELAGAVGEADDVIDAIATYAGRCRG